MLAAKSLLDLACGDGFYTRKFRRAGADPVVGVDLSPQQIAKARRIEEREPLGIEYLAADVVSLELEQRFDVVTAIHLLHYLEGGPEIEAVLRKIHNALEDDGCFVTMIANPEFELERHDPEDSRTKFAYYFSVAEPAPRIPQRHRCRSGLRARVARTVHQRGGLGTVWGGVLRELPREPAKQTPAIDESHEAGV